MDNSENASPNHDRRRQKPPKGMTIADYDVGKGKPPPGAPGAPGLRMWEKGGPSPNPKGRPEKPKLGKRDLDHFLDQKVVLQTDRGPETFTKRELGYLAIANHFGKGAPWAIKLVIQHAQTRGRGKVVDPMLFDPKLTEEILRGIEEEIRKGHAGDEPDKSDGGQS